MLQTINIQDFIDAFKEDLKRNQLLIVSKEEYERRVNFDLIRKENELRKLQEIALSKEWLPISEITKAKLFGNVKNHAVRIYITDINQGIKTKRYINSAQVMVINGKKHINIKEVKRFINDYKIGLLCDKRLYK